MMNMHMLFDLAIVPNRITKLHDSKQQLWMRGVLHPVHGSTEVWCKNSSTSR